MRARAIPLSLKLAYSAWFVGWVPLYWIHNGPANFLWLCDLANFVVLVGLWRESRLLLSSQAAGILFIQALWMADFFGRLVAGIHPLGGTEYMFDPALPLLVRAQSLFHVFVPVVLLWAVWRLGYDRRGAGLQAALVLAVFPLSYGLADPERNLNWVWRPFGSEQVWLPPAAYLAVAMAAYLLLLLLPAHLLLERWRGRFAADPPRGSQHQDTEQRLDGRSR